MIKNYIFDLGNVIAEFYPEKLTAPYITDAETIKTVSDIVFDRLYWDKLDDGRITDHEVKAEIKCRVVSELYETACKVYDNWINNLTPVKGMQRLICDVKQTDKKLFLLSNISIGFANSYESVPWIKETLSAFDGLVFSGPIGLSKPNADIFEYLLRKFDLKSNECLFIDDNESNIKTAEELGINVYLFDGDSEKLRSFLKL